MDKLIAFFQLLEVFTYFAVPLGGGGLLLWGIRKHRINAEQQKASLRKASRPRR